jgi:diaminopimelate epimerase
MRDWSNMRLTKHQALGNDFLVLIDPDRTHDVVTDLVRAACHRRLGIGADGFLHVTPGTDGAAVTMVLYNADGSRPEMSGNGLACVAQALLIGGMPHARRIRVATDAGPKTVDVLPADSEWSRRLRVDLGEARIGDELPEWVEGDVLRAVRVDIGNPHVVLHVAEPEKFDIETVGRGICELTPGGANVEAVGPDDEGALAMVVYERGVGPTDACGTGACASAAAAHHWQLVGRDVWVAMPGGTARIELGDGILMTTQVVHVATVEFHWP